MLMTPGEVRLAEGFASLPSRLPDVRDLLVAVDTETSGLHPDDGARLSMVSLAWGDPSHPERAVFPFDQGFSTPLGPKDQLPKKYQGEGFFDASPNLGPEEFAVLLEWLSRQSLVFHNSKFDLHMLDAGLRGLPTSGMDLSGCTVWDTVVVSPLLFPTEPAGLKPTADRLWGVQSSEYQDRMKIWLKKHTGSQTSWRFDLVPWDLIGPYAAQDAILTLKLVDYQLRAIEEGGAEWEHAERRIDTALMLFRMERRGVGCDVNAMIKASAEVEKLIAQAESEFCSKARNAKRATEDTARKFWFGSKAEGGLGLKPISLTDGGVPSVTQEVVRTLAARGVSGAKEWQRYTKLETANSMWYKPWPLLAGRDGRLRTVYRQTKTFDDRTNKEGGTVSGRLAVERWQVQALPHDRQLPEGAPSVRDFLVPFPGLECYEIDLSQAEMRTVAGRANCLPLVERLRAGGDAHDATTALVFKIDKSSPDWGRLRDVAKRLNFGVLYGAGAATIARQIFIFTGQEVSVEEVQGWLADMKVSMKELYAYGKKLEKRVDRVHNIVLAGGTKRWFNPWDDSRVALNADIQGSVAELMLLAMIDIEAEIPGILIAQVHDSIVVEVDDISTARAAQAMLVGTFEKYIDCPFTSDMKPFGRH